MPDLDALRPGHALAVLVGLVRDHEDLPDALGLQHPRQLGHRHGPGSVLAAGHGHRGIVEDLVGHVGARGHRLANGHRARVEEGAIAEVLEHVRHLAERRHPHPLGPFATHVRDAHRSTFGHGQDHAVTADAGARHRAVGHDGGPVVRAARTKVRLARDGQRRRALAHRLQEGHPRGDGAERYAPLDPGGDDLGDAIGVQLPVGRHQGAVLEVALADDAGMVGEVIEDVADEELHEGALLLDDEDLLQPPRELPHDAGLHREEHADAQQADAVVLQGGVVQPQLEERLAQVVVGLAGGHDAEPRIPRGDGDGVEPVGRREELGRLQAAVVDVPLHVEAERGQQRRILHVLPGSALVREGRGHDGDPLGGDGGRADLVGHVGDDLHARPTGPSSGTARSRAGRDRGSPARCPGRGRGRRRRRRPPRNGWAGSTTWTADRRPPQPGRRRAVPPRSSWRA